MDGRRSGGMLGILEFGGGNIGIGGGCTAEKRAGKAEAAA